LAKIPGVDQSRIYHKRWVAELVGGVPVVAAVAITSIANLSDSDPTKHTLAFIGFGAMLWLIVAGVLKVLQARRQDAKEYADQQYDGLKAALMTVHALVAQKARITGADIMSGKLRATIHRIVPEDEKLEQLIPYVGGKGGLVGRRFDIHSGIIGKAARLKKPFVAKRQNADHTLYIAELISEWSYTDDDARKLTDDRMAWLAVPIFSKNRGEAQAVVYFDSTDSELFTEEIAFLVTYACGGIASYCEEKYK
jgi:hypothetical protein